MEYEKEIKVLMLVEETLQKEWDDIEESDYKPQWTVKLARLDEVLTRIEEARRILNLFND